MTELPDKVDEGLLKKVHGVLVRWAHESYSGENSIDERDVYGSCIMDVISELQLALSDEFYPLKEILEVFMEQWLETSQVAWCTDKRKIAYLSCVRDLTAVVGGRENG